MKNKVFYLLVFSLGFSTSMFAQTSADDFFPLSVGNIWTYDYFISEWEQLLDYRTSDSGAAVYSVLSKSSTVDSTIWALKEFRSIKRHYSSWVGPLVDTSWTIKDSSIFSIIELLTNDHRLYSIGNNWRSVVYLNPEVNDSVGFYRQFPSQASDTFTVAHTKYLGTHLFDVFTVTQRRSIGILNASYTAPGITGYVPFSDHSLKSALITLVGNDHSQHSPENFTLYQNYPNPFNPATEIPFYVPKETKITLRIFDVLGRIVATIYSDLVQAGFHSVVWNGAGQPSGLYFCVAQSSNISKTIKLVLMK